MGDDLGSGLFPEVQRMGSTRDGAFLDLRSHAHLSEATPASNVETAVYRLEVSVEWAGIKYSRTFVLRPIGK